VVRETSHAVKIGPVQASIAPVVAPEVPQDCELWVGAVFARNGSIAEGPVIHNYQGYARGWVTRQGEHDPKAQSAERPGDDTTCEFKVGGRRFLATATLAKVIAPFASVITENLPHVVQPSHYDIDVVATFTHVLSTSVEGDPGLTKAGVESRIDEDFPHLGFHQGMLVDFGWELESFVERPGLKYRIQPAEDDPGEFRPRVDRDP
jgi:hypothetical protein